MKKIYWPIIIFTIIFYPSIPLCIYYGGSDYTIENKKFIFILLSIIYLVSNGFIIVKYHIESFKREKILINNDYFSNINKQYYPTDSDVRIIKIIDDLYGYAYYNRVGKVINIRNNSDGKYVHEVYFNDLGVSEEFEFNDLEIIK